MGWDDGKEGRNQRGKWVRLEEDDGDDSKIGNTAAAVSCFRRESHGFPFVPFHDLRARLTF